MESCSGNYLSERGLVHAIDNRELKDEKVKDLRPLCNWSVLLAGLTDAAPGLRGSLQLLVDLGCCRLCHSQHAYKLCVIQQIALHGMPRLSSKLTSMASASKRINAADGKLQMLNT